MKMKEIGLRGPKLMSQKLTIARNKHRFEFFWAEITE